MSYRRLSRVYAETDTSDIDNTPMLDVVFILLIFFLVTASFEFEQGLDVSSPNQSHSDKSDETSVIVNVSNEGLYSVASRSFSGASLTQYLIALRADQPMMNAVIQVQPRTKTRFIIGAVDSVIRSGLATPSLSLSLT